MSQIIKAQVFKALSLTMGQFVNNLNQFVAAQGLKGGGNGTVDVGRIKDIPGVASQPLLQNQAAPPPTPQAPAVGPQQQGGVGVGGFAATANVGQNISVGQPVTGLNVSNF